MPQPQDFIPEREETVDRFVERIPTQASLKLPERTVEVQVYYLTNEQLTELQRGSEDSSLHFGLWTCALGIAVSLGISILTTIDDLIAKHPRVGLLLTSLFWVALFAAIVEFIFWHRTKKSVASLVEQIKKSQR
jgi:hypothetical protein